MVSDVNWENLRLEDLASPTKNAIVGGPFGSDLIATDYTRTGVPVIRGENLSHGRWVSGDFVYVSHEKAIKLSANTAGPMDVIFTQRGANHYRQVAIVPPNFQGRFVISQSQMKITVDERKVSYLFLYYLFKAPEQRNYLIQNAIQTGVPHTNLSILRKVPLIIPPISVQLGIAQILGALDDKIELNRRMNETLEAMARAIFKDWFVDFGPTRAKMEGRAPYLAPESWSLFPDRLDDEEKPKGWDFFRLDQLAVHHTQNITPMADSNVEFEHFSLPAFDSGQSPAIDLGRAIKSNKTRIPAGAVLLSKLNPEIDRVWLPEPASARLQICSTEFLVFTPTIVSNRALLYAIFTEAGFRGLLRSMVTGTSKSHQRISPSSLMRQNAVVGEGVVFAAFEKLTDGLLRKVLANRVESRTLAATRDLLLPKLMSGEIRVRDAERIVGEVA